jgi:hypothetical protein
MRLVDTTLADDAHRFGPLSVTKTAHAINAVIDRHDPAALRLSRASARGRGRDVIIVPADDDTGTAALWGSLLATDAAILERRLTTMAHHVCDQDPRTLAAGSDQLACTCPTTDCPARTNTDPRATAVVIHIVADPSTLTAPLDPHTSGEETPRPPITPDTTLREALAPDPEPPRSGSPAPRSSAAPPCPPRNWPHWSPPAPKPPRSTRSPTPHPRPATAPPPGYNASSAAAT